MSAAHPPLAAHRAETSRPWSEAIAQPKTHTQFRPTANDVEQMRTRLLTIAESGNPRAARVAAIALKWIAIADAKTPAEYHKLVRQLPVTIERRASTDDRRWMVTTFIAGGKVRLSFPSRIPAVSSSHPTPNDGVQPSGPSAEGRWKSDGNGGCYWDAFDSGPNQCEPTTVGRWKSGGGGSCYFDSNDEGPDQCLPPAESGKCYDGEPPCATEQEMEDLAILVADTRADIEAMEADFNYETSLAQEWCNNHPGACSEPSGPSALNFGNCVTQAAQATVQLASSFGAVVFMEDTLSKGWAAGLRLSLLGKAAVVATALAASFSVGYFVGTAIVCYYEFYHQLPTDRPFLAAAVGCPAVAPAL